MSAFIKIAALLRRREQGANLVEYSILCIAIAVVCIAAIEFFGIEVAAYLQESADALP